MISFHFHRTKLHAMAPVEPERDDEEAPSDRTSGWWDSSLDLLRGLEVVELDHLPAFEDTVPACRPSTPRAA